MDQAGDARDRHRSGRVVPARPSAPPSPSSRILEGLNAPVRSPALSKQRKLLLRRVSELIGGPECRVVLAMSSHPVAGPGRHPARLSLPSTSPDSSGRACVRLQAQLDRDPELMRQLTDASRQPRRARTNR